MTRKVVDEQKLGTRPRGFRKARYIEPEVAALERERIWNQHWLLAGLVSDLQQPGDHFVFDIADEQILITCPKPGEVRAFYNVCQHRGNRLVLNERGNAPRLRCAYHAWTYQLDGTLETVPHAEEFAEDLHCGERHLRPLPCETWNGFVFICLSENPPALMDWLGPLAEQLAPYRFEEMTLVQDQTVRLDCNWKAVVDNFAELYHVDFLHPQHRRMVDCCNDTVHLFERGHTGLRVNGATINPRFPVPEEPTDIHRVQLESLGLDPDEFLGRVLDIRAAVQARKREIGAARGFDYDGFSDEQLSDVWQYNLFPNAILSFSTEHLWILRPRPHRTDPNRCLFDKLSLVRFADPEIASDAQAVLGPGRDTLTASAFRPANYHRPERDAFDHVDVVEGRKDMTDTINQDVELLSNVQAGMRSAGFSDIVLSHEELRVQHFHDQWALDMGRSQPTKETS